MTENLDGRGLKSIIEKYDLFFIDLWGVIHNGIELHNEAVNTLARISEAKKDYILLTNAPRPNKIVKIFLEKMGLKEEMRQRVYTSGQAALSYLSNNYLKKKFFHIGPPRDFDLFYDHKENKTMDIDTCDYLLCTGLFDHESENLNYYKKILSNCSTKKMICTNPDLIVDRGKKRELCAGSVAMTFEEIGGNVIYFGKPYPEVYNQSIQTKEKRIIAIGDNLNTDIKGANNMNYDSLIITNGIHKNEFEKEGVEKILKKYNVISTYSQSNLKWWKSENLL